MVVCQQAFFFLNVLLLDKQIKNFLAWMRMKFPNVIDLTIASSAPILLFKGRVSYEEYFHVFL